MGLGKLGLPVALAVESKGHEVFGYDISQKTVDNIQIEQALNRLLDFID